jgi:hypothetical protein
MALHSLGDEINPPSRGTEDDEAGAEARRNRRAEIIRMNRLELIRRAREEGVAVDLDELTAIGEREAAIANARGFEDFVSHDGTLRSVSPRPEMSQTTVAASTGADGMRYRGAGARGMNLGMASAPWANPFDDDAQVLFDRQLIGTDDEEKALLQASRKSTQTLSPAPLVDTSDTASEYFSEAELEAQIEEAIRRSLIDVSDATPLHQEENSASDPPTSVPAAEDTAMSNSEDDLYYYAPPPNVSQPASHQTMFSAAMEDMMQANLQNPTATENADRGFVEDDESHTPSGTLTPTDDGYSVAASMASSNGNDVAAMSDFHSEAGDDENETPAPLFGNAPVHHDEGMSDAGYSTDTFSIVGPGTSTPGSWSDVGSEAGEEEGHQGQMEYQNLEVGQ